MARCFLDWRSAFGRSCATFSFGPDKLDALDHEVDAICALALKHITQETMEAEAFQVFAGVVNAGAASA